MYNIETFFIFVLIVFSVSLNIFLVVRRRGSGAADAAENWHRSLVDSFPDAIIVHDKGQLAYMNPAAAAMFGISSLAGKEKISLYDFVQDEYHATLAKSMQSLLQGTSQDPSVEIKFLRREGGYADVEMTSATVRFGGKEMVQSVLRDITKKRAMEERTEYLSTHDLLTGLHNHFYLHKQLQKFSGRREFNGGVIMLDIKELKKANETYGHSVGDELIKAAADLISGESREGDVVSCIGGDKFCILLPNTDPAKISAVVARLRTKIRAARVRDIEMRIAVGTAYAKSGNDLDAAIKIAEEDMLKDKRSNQ